MKNASREKRGSEVFSPNSMRRTVPLFPANFFSAGLALLAVVVAGLTSSPFGRRSSTTNSTRIYGAHGGRYVLWLIVLLSLTYFQFTAAAGPFCLGRCLLCVMNAALCATLRALLAWVLSLATRDPEDSTCLSSNNDTRTDLLIRRSNDRTIAIRYTTTLGVTLLLMDRRVFDELDCNLVYKLIGSDYFSFVFVLQFFESLRICWHFERRGRRIEELLVTMLVKS